MKAFSFGDVVAIFERRLKSVPKAPYLIAAAILVGLGLWARSIGFVRLKQLCDAIVADLGLIQPFGLIRIYFQSLVACDHYEAFSNCSAWRFLNPLRFVGALLPTVGTVWEHSVGPGRIILPLALIGSFPIAVSLVLSTLKRMSGTAPEFNLVHAVIAALLTPFVASIFALVLQVLAIVLFFVFGAVVGLLLWLATVFAGIWTTWRLARDVESTARKLQDVAETVADVTGSDPKGGGTVG